MPLLFRNHICFVYLAHSRSPVITCGKNKWVSGFPLAPPWASVSPGERRCGWPSLLSQGGHCPWPWQDPHSYFGPLCCPVLPGTSGDHAKGVSWVRACHGPTHWLLAVLRLRGGGGWAFGKQAQVGKCPQDMGMCFLEAAGTWLPGRGMSAPSFWPGAGFICSRKGLVLYGAACERGGRGAQGCQPRAVGRLQSLGKDPCIGAGGSGRGLLEFRQTSAPPKLNA